MPNLRLDEDEVNLIINFLKNPEASAASNKPVDLVGSHGH
jgi:hypothetical protein